MKNREGIAIIWCVCVWPNDFRSVKPTILGRSGEAMYMLLSHVLKVLSLYSHIISCSLSPLFTILLLFHFIKHFDPWRFTVNTETGHYRRGVSLACSLNDNPNHYPVGQVDQLYLLFFSSLFNQFSKQIYPKPLRMHSEMRRRFQPLAWRCLETGCSPYAVLSHDINHYTLLFSVTYHLAPLNVIYNWRVWTVRLNALSSALVCPSPQVVQRIKALEGETRLLVVDRRTDELLRSLRLTATEEMAVRAPGPTLPFPAPAPASTSSSPPSPGGKKRENGSVPKQGQGGPGAQGTKPRRSASRAAKKVTDVCRADSLFYGSPDFRFSLPWFSLPGFSGSPVLFFYGSLVPPSLVFSSLVASEFLSLNLSLSFTPDRSGALYPWWTSILPVFTFF